MCEEFDEEVFGDGKGQFVKENRQMGGRCMRFDKFGQLRYGD